MPASKYTGAQRRAYHASEGWTKPLKKTRAKTGSAKTGKPKKPRKK